MAQLSPALKQATPLIVDYGRGCELFSETGDRYLDLTSGIGVTSTGHSHPRVVAAVQQQAEKLLHGQYGVVRHKPLLELLDRLSSVLPPALESVFFANSGAEAVEAAVRVARNFTGRQNVVVFQGSFHGRTLATSALTTSGNRFRAAASGSLPSGVVVAPFPDAFRYGWSQEEANRFCLKELDHIFATITSAGDVAAMIVEPVLGEAGYLPGSAEFFQGLRERADRHGIVLIFDEIQAGVARTGKFWAHEHFGVEADAVTFAKGIASGLPISGVATRKEIMEAALPGSQGGTYAANVVACAAAIATLDVIEEESLIEHAARMGARLRAGLEAVAAKYSELADVRGLGLMQATEFRAADGSPMPEQVQAVLGELFDRGVIALACGPYGSIVRMIPALVIDEEEIDEAIEAWDAAIAAVLNG